MNRNEVPQDEGSLSRKNMHELCYAVDDQGRYTTVQSSGWEAKTLALNESLKLIEERVAAAAQAVRDGRVSPIAYYMELNRMDVSLLAGYVGMHRWLVKRHFDPKRFRKLKDSVLQKYAEAFDISVNQLTDPFSPTDA